MVGQVDPRALGPTRLMLERRQRELDAGAGHLGWKVAFGSPAGMTLLGTDRPLVGFLTERRAAPPGATLPVGSWTRPMLEVEVAAWLGDEVLPGATPAEALAAVDGWSVAIELADVDHVPADPARFVPDNIFHRHVLIGPEEPRLPEPLSARSLRDGEEVAATSDPYALTGEPGPTLASIATLLAAAGAGLVAGDVVILGSVVPPIEVAPGQSWVGAVPGLGEVGVSLSR